LDLDLNKITENLKQNDFVKKFIKELNSAFEGFDCQKGKNGENMNNTKFTSQEDMEFYRKKTEFLENYFSKELSNSKSGTAYIVTDKYENDHEHNRYKVAQYKDGKEYKYVAFKKDLPENVSIGDVVRKVDGKYICDEQATKYINDTLKEFEQEIIDSRNSK
jgi:hypothetical protein